jgi:hypothetical protein
MNLATELKRTAESNICYSTKDNWWAYALHNKREMMNVPVTLEGRKDDYTCYIAKDNWWFHLQYY